MPAYPDLVRAIQQRRQLFKDLLVKLDFTSGPMFVWTGVDLPRESGELFS